MVETPHLERIETKVALQQNILPMAKLTRADARALKQLLRPASLSQSFQHVFKIL
jgi:hypothetical protein